jgi:hypothetical protein
VAAARAFVGIVGIVGALLVVILGEALWVGLAALGVEALYGDPAAGLDVVPAPASWAAQLLSVAHSVMGGISATVDQSADGVRVQLGGEPSEGNGSAGPVVLAAPESVGEALRLLAEQLALGLSPVLEVQADLAAPVDEVRLVGALSFPAPPALELDADVLSRLASASAPVLHVGPGVVRRRCVDGLHAAAAALDCGVLNTWGAKGVFDWRSPHHWATVGLQQRDAELGGLDGADLVLGSGLSGPEGDRAVHVRPESLAQLAVAARGRPPTGVAAGTVPMPPLRTLLADVTQRGWGHDGPRAVPSQVTRNYGRFTAGRGLVAAGPGHAGYWIARTFPTTVLGEAVVPEERVGEGFALAAALVALRRDPWRPVVAALDGLLDERSSVLLEWARSTRASFVVEVWEPDAQAVDADAHDQRLSRARWAARDGGPAVLRLTPEKGQLDEMVEAAGPVIAWGGITTS